MNEKQLLTLLNGAPFRKFTIAEQILLKKFAEVGRWITETGNPLLFLGKGARLLQHYIYSCSLQQNGTPTPTSPKPLVCSNGAISYRNKITIDGTEYVLPADVQLLESLSSDGHCYCDTNIVPTGEDDITIRYKHKGRGATTSSFFGCMPSNAQTTPRVSFGKYSSGRFCGYNATEKIGDIDTEWHIVRIFYDGAYKKQNDGETPITYTPQTENEPTLSAYIFARHGTNGVQVYDGEGTEIAHIDWKDQNGGRKAYIVGVNKGGTLGMYDVITNTFYANAGTGTLTAGDKVAKEMITLGRTDNEFDKDANGTSCNGSLSYNGSISINGTSGTFKMPCEPNTQYTIGFVAELGTTIFRVATTQNEFVGTAMNTLDHYIGTTIKTYTFVTNANAHWLYMQTNSAKFDDVRDVLMLIKGSTVPTEYIPYWSLDGEKGKAKLNNILPLGYTQLEYIDNNNNAYLDLGIPIGSSDTAGPELPNGTIIDLPTIIKGNIDLVTGQGTEEWGIKVLDGTENIVKDGNRYYYQPVDMLKEGATRKANLKCTHFVPSTVGNTGQCFKYNAEIYLYPDMTLYPNAEAFKSWLSTQYANGTPMIVCFPKSTASAISVTPVALRQKDGQNEASATLKELQGELSVTYYGDLKMRKIVIKNPPKPAPRPIKTDKPKKK